MKAMVLREVVSLQDNPQPLEMVDLPEPIPGPNELLIRVSACGVCHTELDEIEGRTPPPRLPVVLGHEVVGVVVKVGEQVDRFEPGARVGVGWIHSSCGGAEENLSPDFRATGRDVNGGYAERLTVPAEYAHAIPDVFSDVEAAPLLCAGAIGFRALRLTGIRNGRALGLIGFGASAHLVMQLVRHLYPEAEVYVFAREASQREFARQLGAVWSGDIMEASPRKMHAIIDTTPAWRPMVAALANLRPGGRLVINAIRKEDADKSQLLDLRYEDHLWMEKEIKSVANITSRDIAEFLPIAAAIPIKPDVTTFPLCRANEALMGIHRGGVRGAHVLTVNDGEE